MNKVDFFGYRYTGGGKCEAGTRNTFFIMSSWFKEAHRSKAVSMKRKCGRMASHVCSVASHGSVKWWWLQEMMKKVKGQGDSDDEKDSPFQEARSAGLEDMSHQNN